MNWLFKEEPSSYSFDDLCRDGRTRWAGVRNPLAQKHLKAVRKGDRILYYHTGGERAVVGTARAAGDAYPDPADRSGKRAAVDIVPQTKLDAPVPLAAIKSDRRFAALPLVRISRLSVMPIDDKAWAAILALSRRA